MSQLRDTYDRFAACVSSGKEAQATALLNELKLLLLESDDAEVGRRTMEQAVLLSVATKDAVGFQRYLAQLKPFYALDESSELRPTLLGLELLFLIVENRLAEFHMALETLAEADRNCECVAFAIKLEQNLMVGTYDQVLRAQAHMPSPYFAFFMSRLLDTVRDTVAECAEAAYASLSLEAAQDLLMFDNAQDLKAFVAAKKWRSDGNLIVFDAPSRKPKSSDIPSLKLITENLAYATELERIV